MVVVIKKKEPQKKFKIELQHQRDLASEKQYRTKLPEIGCQNRRCIVQMSTDSSTARIRRKFAASI